MLSVGQAGTSKIANRWDRPGVVIEVGKFDQYLVKVDKSGRVTCRNRKRKFQRKVTPYQTRQAAFCLTDPSMQKHTSLTSGHTGVGQGDTVDVIRILQEEAERHMMIDLEKQVEGHQE